MHTNSKNWRLTILDGLTGSEDAGGLTVGDLDNDGRVEIIVAGKRALYWYRPDTFEKGIISEQNQGTGTVGITLEDIDGDGILEVVTGQENLQTSKWMIVWFKPGADMYQPWTRNIIDSEFSGHCHDLVFVDIDGDGKNELVASPASCPEPGVFLYKRQEDVTRPWVKHVVSQEVFTEGIAVGDIDGDGRMEIISGPDYYTAPIEGPFACQWQRSTYAPNFREMCRVSLMDIAGNGKLDVIAMESEYMEGRLSWFENLGKENSYIRWAEHPITDKMVFGHSMSIRRNEKGCPSVFIAEMAQGGFDAPCNYDARLIEISTMDGGKTWQENMIYQGEGTHQAVMYDVDGDGKQEIVGKTWGEHWKNPKVQIWKYCENPSIITNFKQRFIDRDKPYTAINIVLEDIDGDGTQDVACGAWWYKNPTWERYEIPGIVQVLKSFDIDGDGINELLALKKPRVLSDNWYENLSSDLCWLKPIDPANGKWEEYYIGKGIGDWPHGILIAPVLPNGKLALICSYHSAYENMEHYPEIFEVPDDPKSGPWPVRTLAKIKCNGEIEAADINGNGRLDIVTGAYWLENMGNGNFLPHKICEGFEPAAICIADINGDGRPDIIMGEEVLGYGQKDMPYSRLAWFENPADPVKDEWKMHVLDTVRCAHSVGIGDLDGDGELEIVCGEHDHTWPYRTQSRLFVYKKAEPGGRSWYRYTLDNRFEHHVGTRIIDLGSNRSGIVSHGWRDNIYVNLWE